MSVHKNTERICVAAVILALIITVAFMNGELLGIEKASGVAAYENRLFDTERVHTIDIITDDWEGFLDTCQSEEYTVCDLVIDGEAFNNVAIRGKGNTSLSNVASMDSDRYSFKIEFDHYNSSSSYYGLDKLSLNNIIQDNTYMKDYLSYRLMGEFGVAAPLCSFVYITVGGEEWGLYLAVEGVEEAFLSRNFGKNYGELYKPDSMSFGGGRGNGKDFDMDAFMGDSSDDSENTGGTSSKPQRGERPEGFDPSQGGNGNMPEMPEMPENFNPEEVFGSGKDFGGAGGEIGGRGSNDVKLQYIDDSVSSYSNIFNNAKTDVTSADKTRLIEALKVLSQGKNIESVVDIEQVLRYFVVHNFVCNGDSYTGSMIHNYYLYENDSKMSMIPWDYNLAFGTFQSANTTSTVNTPIDTPVSGGTGEDRPMINWIFANESYTQMYHEYFREFLASVNIGEIIEKAETLISPYVEKDPTKFCTYEEFVTGVSTLKEFCALRSESVAGQLDGTIPATSEGQSADSAALIDACAINISDMGTMSMGGGHGGKGDRPDNFGDNKGGHAADSAEKETTAVDGKQEETTKADNSQEETSANENNIPPRGERPNFPEGGEMPEPPQGGEMPDMGQMPQGGEMPGGRGERPQN